MPTRQNVEVTAMFDPHVMLVSADTAPAWLDLAFFAFWAALPQLLPLLLGLDD